MNLDLFTRFSIFGIKITFNLPLLVMPNDHNRRSTTTTKRGKIEIIAKILKVALDGARTTHIIYRANLDTRSLKRHLDFLMGMGLLTLLNDKPRIYKTTDKGRVFLNHYRKLQETLSSD